MGSPNHANPGVWETIFASPLVVVAARVVILSAAAILLLAALYIAISIVYRMRHGQWLHRAGPFEAHLAERGEGAVDNRGAARELFAAAIAENSALRAKVAERDRQLKELADTMKTKHF